MALSLSKMQTRLRPYLLKHLENSQMAAIDDGDFIDLFNRVAHDLNEMAHLNVERYYKETGTDNSEDSDAINYLVQGKIAKVYSFKYEADDWRDRKWSFVDDRILFDSVTDGIQMDLRYLRRCEVIASGTDEIDLPFEAEDAYLELLKVRAKVDFGGAEAADYETALEYYKSKVNMMAHKRLTYERGVRRSWFDLTGDDNVYEIVHQYIGLENWLLGVDTNYTYLGGNA